MLTYLTYKQIHIYIYILLTHKVLTRSYNTQNAQTYNTLICIYSHILHTSKIKIQPTKVTQIKISLYGYLLFIYIEINTYLILTVLQLKLTINE